MKIKDKVKYFEEKKHNVQQSFLIMIILFQGGGYEYTEFPDLLTLPSDLNPGRNGQVASQSDQVYILVSTSLEAIL